VGDLKPRVQSSAQKPVTYDFVICCPSEQTLEQYIKTGHIHILPDRRIILKHLKQGVRVCSGFKWLWTESNFGLL